MSRHRWDYMGRPGFNPPNNDCPECTSPSKTYYIGGKTVDGVAQHRYKCEHGHEWIKRGSEGGTSRVVEA